MRKERKEFVPITPDIDERLDRLADAKGVPKLVHPDVASDGKAAAPVQAPPAPAEARPRMKSVTLDLPDYVWSELKIRAVQDESSLRHIVMTALKEFGITIKDADMVQDGRRLR